ncbi:FKBP-type peptidyl-prolyl cis-trans isomerase [Zooshikella marina]|uniref:FKBP-type peptidyl-prolyl cis-trans isomerase n=1 Tax=Zooshikella ganghwensis TaxID=202772 RepID=UPI001BAFBE4D|nr:FKBP-type peptidyl-prolyl cis-trans isomerase [Zooshikella ganghwensis]MBU2706523.1 FKBP-type peptidyl-prolyl cis-trans isomerase [Zooshikella ganghwensis]
MKLKVLTAGLVLATASQVFAEPVKLTNDKQKLSYSLGVMFAQRLKADFKYDDLDLNVMSAAMANVLKEEKTAIDEQEMIKIIQKAQRESYERAQKRMEKEAKENLAKEKAFLEKNAKADGIIKTDSGLQYKVITKGEGEKPKAESTVVVHYEGRTLDGNIFDSSYKRGEPATFGVNQVIPGWTEALQLMPQGSVWELYIPSELAYGPGGIPNKISPNSTLIFKVELKEIKQPEKVENAEKKEEPKKS